jgi:hypothetical protein
MVTPIPSLVGDDDGFSTVNDLGNLYKDRGKQAKAKWMYERALY